MLDEAQARIKFAGRTINNLKYDATLMAERARGLSRAFFSPKAFYKSIDPICKGSFLIT